MSTRKTTLFPPGMEIDGRFRVLKHVGDGGMGAVYLCRHLLLDRDVAIKFIPLAAKAQGKDPEAVFRREVLIQAKLQHRFLLAVIDGGILNLPETPQPFGYIVMEYVKGGSLRSRMVRAHTMGERIDRRVAMRVLTQAAIALRVIHASGAIHRDVKPENVLIGEDGIAKVGDFGNSRFLTSSKYMTDSVRPVATLPYTPHEQLLNTGMDTKVDAFALGVMAWELLEGKHPIAAEGLLPTREEMFTNLVAKQPFPDVQARLPDVPKAVREILHRAVSHEPAERPTMSEMAEVFAAYEEALSDASAAAEAKTAPTPPPKEARQNEAPTDKVSHDAPTAPAPAPTPTPARAMGPRGTIGMPADQKAAAFAARGAPAAVGRRELLEAPPDTEEIAPPANAVARTEPASDAHLAAARAPHQPAAQPLARPAPIAPRVEPRPTPVRAAEPSASAPGSRKGILVAAIACVISTVVLGTILYALGLFTPAKAAPKTPAPSASHGGVK